MNTKFTIKNFRVFDENGVTLDLKPLTILTGCNSSGKSSIVKAAFLLNSFMKQVNKAIENGEKIELSNYKIDFTSYPNNLLGRFDKVIPTGSSSRKIALGYTVYSHMISKDVNVNLVFAVNKNDDLNNAYLDSISMSTDEGVFYSSDKEKGNCCNLNIIKKYCQDYLRIEFYIDYFCGLSSEYEFGDGSISKDEFKEQGNAMLDILRGLGKSRVEDVARYIRTQKRKFRPIASKDELGLLDWTEQNGSYFNIPILDYLKDIPKDEVSSIVKEILASGDKDNTLCSSPIAVDSATNKVIEDFINSDFTSICDYFKDYENRHFEAIRYCGNRNVLSMLSVGLNQTYTQSYPGRGGWITVSFLDDEKGEIQLNEHEKEIETQQKVEKWESQPLTFDILYEVVMIWNEKYTREKSVYYEEGHDVKDGLGSIFNYPDGYHHHAFGMLAVFANRLAEEVICPTSFNNMSYISSSRATVKKLYALDAKDDFTELLHRYFEANRNFEDKNDGSSNTPDYKANSFLDKWIKLFGIGESLSFKLDNEGLGVKIYLRRSEGSYERLLADEGYGITQLMSILLQIETAILSAKGKKTMNLWGLSLFDKYDTSVFHFEENTIAIEEPEIHLHPRFQSLLAEMFVEAYKKYNIHFIIETHSEYLIRKLQTYIPLAEINEKEGLKPEEISLYYLYNPDPTKRPKKEPQVKKIGFRKDGSLNAPFGSGFFDEADNLAMSLLIGNN